MLKVRSFVKKNWLLIFIFMLMIVGLVLRVGCCFHGYPQHLSGDERATVDYAIEMLSRHSWEAHSYDRPDHFEIKCDAVVFSIVSWAKYGMPAYEAFENHPMTFYLLGRLFTALFGIALIPVSVYFCEHLFKELELKYRRILQVSVALIITFSYIFVRHSGYATPDIVMTFFTILFSYGVLRYLDVGTKKYLYLCIICIGIGITIKYPSAILCLPLAGMVIYRALFIDKNIRDIFKYGIISIGGVMATVFVIAPNLFTNIKTVYENFIQEARPTHLGQDGLGFFGNLRFYADTSIEMLGLCSIVFFVIGFVFLLVRRNRKSLSLLVGVIYWICMSVLSLHWLRWGIPIYPFYSIVVSLGISGCIYFADKVLKKNLMICRFWKITTWMGAGILLLNVILSGFAITKFCLLTDTRYTSYLYAKEAGITKEESLYEGYTGFEPALSIRSYNSFDLQDEKVQIDIKNAAKKYFMMSDNFKNRYLAEPERYEQECAIYHGIENTYDIVYRVGVDGNYEMKPSAIKNILHTAHYLTTKFHTTGQVITIYDLDPAYITLQNKATGQFLGSELLSEDCEGEVYSWVKYDLKDGTSVLISVAENKVLQIAKNGSGYKMELINISDEDNPSWSFIEADGGFSLVNEDNLALSIVQDKICLEEYTGAENQIWMIHSTE